MEGSGGVLRKSTKRVLIVSVTETMAGHAASFRLNPKIERGQSVPVRAAKASRASNHDAGNEPFTTALLTAVSSTPTAEAMFFRPTASAN